MINHHDEARRSSLGEAAVNMSRLSHRKSLPAPLFMASESGRSEAAQGDTTVTAKARRGSYHLSPNLCAATSALTGVTTSVSPDEEPLMQPARLRQLCAAGGCTPLFRAHHYDVNGEGGGNATRLELKKQNSNLTTTAAAADEEGTALRLTSVACRDASQSRVSVPRSGGPFQSPTLTGGMPGAQPHTAASAPLTCEGSVLSVSTTTAMVVPSRVRGCDTPAQSALTPPSPPLSRDSSFALPLDLGACVLTSFPARWQDVTPGLNETLSGSDDDEDDEACASPLSTRLGYCGTTPMPTTGGWASAPATQLRLVLSPHERRVSSAQTPSLPASSMPSRVSMLSRTPREEVQLEMSKLHAIAASRAMAAAAAQGSTPSCYLAPRSVSTPRPALIKGTTASHDVCNNENDTGDDEKYESSSTWSDDEAAAPDAGLNRTLPPPQAAATSTLSPVSQNSIQPVLCHTAVPRPTAHESNTPLMLHHKEHSDDTNGTRQGLQMNFREEREAAPRDSLCPLHELLDLIEVAEVFQLRANKATGDEVPLALQMDLLTALHRALRLQQLLHFLHYKVNPTESALSTTTRDESDVDSWDAAMEDAACVTAQRRASEDFAHTVQMLLTAWPHVLRNVRVAQKILRCKRVTLRWADEILSNAIHTIEQGMTSSHTATLTGTSEAEKCLSHGQCRSTLSSCCDTPGINGWSGPSLTHASPTELPERQGSADMMSFALPEMLHQLELELFHELGLPFAQFVTQCHRRMLRLALVQSLLDTTRKQDSKNATQGDSPPLHTAGADDDDDEHAGSMLHTDMDAAITHFAQSVQQQHYSYHNSDDAGAQWHDVKLAFHDLPDMTEVALHFSFMRHSSSWAWWYRLYAQTHPTQAQREACLAALCEQAHIFCRNDERGRSLVQRVQHDPGCVEEVLQGSIAAARDDVRHAMTEYDHAVHHILRHLLQRLCLVRGCWCVERQERVASLVWLRGQQRSVRHALHILHARTGLSMLHELRAMLQSVHVHDNVDDAAMRNDDAEGSGAHTRTDHTRHEERCAAPQTTCLRKAELALLCYSCAMPAVERQVQLERFMQAVRSLIWQLCRLLPCTTHGKETSTHEEGTVVEDQWRQRVCPRSMQRLHSSLDELCQSLRGCLSALQKPELHQCQVTC